MHLKITFYFLHILISGMLAGLALSIAGTLYFEDITRAIPLLASSFIVAAGWFFWRLQIQRKYKFSMTQRAFKTFLPVSLVVIGAMTLGTKELMEVMMVNPPRIKYLLYITGAVAGLAVVAQILDFEKMPRRERISYKRGRDRRDETQWKRSSGRRAFQA